MSAQANASKGTVGVVGLGIMGGAMARELVKVGYAVVGFDIEAAAMQRLQGVGGKARGSAREVAVEADVLIVSVATSAALTAVVQDIAAAERRPGAPALLVLETSTLPLADKDAAQASLA